MGRKPTKSLSNPLCQARLQMAEYDPRFHNKEFVSELLHISSSQLQDYELGITKCIPADSILRMADIYQAPHLVNYYCHNMCPLGERIPELEDEDLDRTTLKALPTLKKISWVKETLEDIAADGVISEDEEDAFQEILDVLDKVSYIAQQLRVHVVKKPQRRRWT